MNDIDQFPKRLPDDHIPYFYKGCMIERIYDGDTISVTIDHGFGLMVERISLRLFGINAPEVRGAEKEQGKVTRDWLRGRLCKPDTVFDRWGYITDGSQNFINLQTVKVGKNAQAKGKFGRYLAILWDNEGVNINWEIIDRDLAKIANY